MMSFMLKAQEIPFFRLKFSKKKSIWADLRFCVFSSKNSVVDLIVDKVSLDSSYLWSIEGE